MQTQIDTALREDAAFADLTGIATIAADAIGHARIIAKQAGVLSGCLVAEQVFRTVDKAISQHWLKKDGEQVASGDTVCELQGSLRQLLAAERTALNFMQHLSGIATATHAFAELLADTGCCIVDTRKTTPGLRLLEKQAVLHGGGENHRMDLASGMLIKENHIAAAGSITAAIASCRRQASDIWVEVECETLDEVREAVAAAPDIILLDNMSPAMVQEARDLVPPTIILEASGNITLANARDYAATGVNRIAVGAITHSAPALDLSMRVSG